MSKKIVVASRRFFMKYPDLSYFKKRAEKIGATVVPVKEESQFPEKITDASAIVVIGKMIGKDIIQTLSQCKCILAMQVGYDCVDIEAATKKGIAVCNIPTYCTDDVATHAMTLLLAVAKKFRFIITETERAHWDYNPVRPVYNLREKTLGIIGLGRIGRALVSKARGFGLHIAAYDPYIHDDIFTLLGVTRTYELDELLHRADYISIHAPLTPETENLINTKNLKEMKKSAILINTARSRIVDYAALYQALNDGTIAGAGIDVFDEEPPSTDNPFLSCKKVIVTPHIAWYSEESLQVLMEYGMDEIERVLTGKRPRWILNPEVLS